MVVYYLEYHLVDSDVNFTTHCTYVKGIDSLIETLSMLSDLDQEVDTICTFHVPDDVRLPFDV